MLTLVVLFIGAALLIFEPKERCISYDLCRGLIPTLLALGLWKGRLTAEFLGFVFITGYIFKVGVLNKEPLSIPIIVGSLWPLAPRSIGLMSACWLAGLVLYRKKSFSQSMWVLGGLWSLVTYHETWLMSLVILLVIIVMGRHIMKQWSIAR